MLLAIGVKSVVRKSKAKRSNVPFWLAGDSVMSERSRKLSRVKVQRNWFLLAENIILSAV